MPNGTFQFIRTTVDCWAFSGKGVYNYIDTMLPFGLHFVPKIFNFVADALEWIAHTSGVEELVNYLDDFLVMGAPETSQCTEGSSSLLQ